MFIATQAFRMGDERIGRAVDIVQAVGWAVWPAVLLAFLPERRSPGA